MAEIQNFWIFLMILLVQFESDLSDIHIFKMVTLINSIFRAKKQTGFIGRVKYKQLPQGNKEIFLYPFSSDGHLNLCNSSMETQSSKYMQDTKLHNPGPKLKICITI